MKKIISILVLVLILVFNQTGIGQINRTLPTKVADALALVPTQDIPKLNSLMADVVSLQADGFALFVSRIVAPGTGDDVAPRFIIASLSKYVSQYGKQEDRKMVETGLLKAIKGATDKEVQSFFFTQLYFVATDQSVEVLSHYLLDEKLCDASIKVLIAIGTPSAQAALLKGLELSNGMPAIALAKATGDLRIESASPVLIKKLADSDQKMQRVVYESLAQIAAKSTAALLSDRASKVKYLYEPTGIVTSLITFADRMGEKGELAICKKVLDEVISNCKNKNQLQFRSAALSLKSKYWGMEILPLLLKEFDNPDKAYRAGLLNLAATMQDISATRRWIAKLKEVSPEKRAEIVAMLGRSCNPVLISLFANLLSDPSEIVRISAIESLSSIKTIQAVVILENHLTRGMDVSVTAKALSGRLDGKHLSNLATALDGAPKAAKIEIIRLIGAKGGPANFERISSFVGDADQDIAFSAMVALKNLSDQKSIPILLDLLRKVVSKEQISAVQQALVHASSGFANEKKVQFINQLSKISDQGRTLGIFSRLGGREALKMVADAFESGKKEIREDAFGALIKWSSADAGDVLFQICANNPDYQVKAYRGFVELIGSSPLPDDQKLLQYRKIMPLASGKEQKIMVLSRLGDLRTFPVLLYLRSFLDDNDLKSTAAASAIQVALPGSGKTVGLTGEITKTILGKAMGLLTGSESDYDKEKVKKYLASMPDDQGFVPIFNGKDLTGWKGLVGNPISRAKMTPKELAAKQAEANTKALNNWSVKENSIVFNGAGDNLCSEKQYGDFEMIVDWRITKKGDSGIYLRGSPQIQIWDTSRVEVGAQVGSGGLYNNAKFRSTPLKVADNPVGDWNHFYIKMTGEKVTVYLNGVLVVDQVPLENYWDRSLPIFPKEAIELQAHGTDLAFRDIYVKEINDNRYVLPAEEQKEGFKPLFNGVDFEGWTGNTIDYEVKNGEIVLNVDNGPSHGNLFTQGEYGDFIFRFEFQLTPGANNGLGIRAPLEGDAAYVGMELQILDDDAPIYAQLQPYQYHGSVYGVIPAKRGSLKPNGEWNFEEVIVKGNNVKVILNGNVITEGDIAVASRNGTMDHKEHPGLLRTTGHIGFLGHGSVVKFRNIRIKEQ